MEFVVTDVVCASPDGGPACGFRARVGSTVSCDNGAEPSF